MEWLEKIWGWFLIQPPQEQLSYGVGTVFAGLAAIWAMVWAIVKKLFSKKESVGSDDGTKRPNIAEIADHIANLDEEDRKRLARTEEALRGIEIEKPEQKPRIETALKELQKGRSQLARGIFHEVFDEARRKGQEENGRAAIAARHLATLQFGENKAKALEYLRQAVELNPQDLQAWHDLGDVAMKCSVLSEAEQAYTTLLSLAEKNQDDRRRMIANGQLALVYSSSHNLEKAESVARVAQKLAVRQFEKDPNNVEWKTDIVVSLVKLSTLDKKSQCTHLQQALTTVVEMRKAGHLTSDQEKWEAAITDMITAENC